MALFGGNSGGGNKDGDKKSVFGAAPGGSSNLFGANNTNNTAPKPLFGAPTGGAGLFGGGTPTASPFGQTGASAAKPANPSFGFGTSTTSGAQGGSTTATTTPSLFGAAPAGPSAGGAGPFSFGNASSTPSAPKTFSLSSTTPAGPPPGPSIFGTAKPAQAPAASQPAVSSLFAPQPAATSAPGTQPPPSLFGQKPAGTQQPAPSVFGQKPAGSQQPTPSVFGQSPAATSGAPTNTSGATPSSSAGLFALGGNKNASADANKTTPTQQTQPTASLGFAFGGAKPSGAPGTQAASTTPLFSQGSTTPAAAPANKPTFGLGANPLSQPASAAPKAFSLGATATSTPATTSQSTSNLFGSLSGAKTTPAAGISFLQGASAAATTTAPPPATTATSTTAPGTSAFPTLGAGLTPTSGAAPASGATPSLFSKPATMTTQPATTSATTTSGPSLSTAGASKPLGSAATSGDAAKPGLGASTTGPAPSAQSRLKNKSMDEIITRWAGDLSKYQKEFQSQAEQVAAWDRALVENTEKVSKLYAKTWQAEHDANEVERQLSTVEENQQELDHYLDRYEKEVENLMKQHGVSGQGRSDGLRGSDQERERTYKLAEKLQDRLNELNKDLTEMIEEINNTSQTLSKTGKADDPLTKVVRVLNSQLSQLQTIDSGANQLQEKINKVQKDSQRAGTNGWNGLGTNPADDFMRSFKGGRSDRFGGVS